MTPKRSLFILLGMGFFGLLHILPLKLASGEETAKSSKTPFPLYLNFGFGYCQINKLRLTDTAGFPAKIGKPETVWFGGSFYYLKEPLMIKYEAFYNNWLLTPKSKYNQGEVKTSKVGFTWGGFGFKGGYGLSIFAPKLILRPLLGYRWLGTGGYIKRKNSNTGEEKVYLDEYLHDRGLEFGAEFKILLRDNINARFEISRVFCKDKMIRLTCEFELNISPEGPLYLCYTHEQAHHISAWSLFFLIGFPLNR